MAKLLTQLSINPGYYFCHLALFYCFFWDVYCHLEPASSADRPARRQTGGVERLMVVVSLD